MQAVRDLFLTYNGIEEEIENESDHDREPLKDRASRFGSIGHYVLRYWDILMVRRLRNALIATGIVALSQQLSGINLMAFYGGSTLVGITPGDPSSLESDSKVSKAMLYNVIFGLLNFLFCLPGIYFIDVWGRRRILLLTIPFMAICLMGAAVSSGRLSREVVATWLYLHTVSYSPGMGPVPFILAAESFPLTYRDTGASIAISINFLFAGLLAWLQPLLVDSINFNGTLGVFSGLNVVAFVLIFLLVEETNLNSLETLYQVFNRPKREFMRFQIFEILPWCWKFIIGTRTLNKPNFNDSHRQQVSVHEDEDEERLRDTSQDIRLTNMSGGNGRG
jgi:MFS family permease